ncbi:PAS domain-containing sensor histidine kinase [Pelovirga terrestris]|uniref:histidine kinase n=1 Tax=Pelovirga terrestris TaxID=2771352 RepID=A0A8J6QLD0_9BACT|nr:PAS domain-containing sensor histidine kinase [Pelovirga terrestris]MBD1399217.1 HAMP domain-containing protein [Pelovirga terrestris]
MLRIKLHTKVLGALLLLALVPLILLLFSSHHSLRLVEDLLRQRTTETLDFQATRALEKRTQMVADQISAFLQQIEENLLDLALLEPHQENYQKFGDNHQRQIWYRRGSNLNPTEIREAVPLYSELAFIDTTGIEQVRIVNGQPCEQLRDITNPYLTTYPAEDYFKQAARLSPGDIWVTRLTGWHISRDEQLQGAATPLEAIEGKKYSGVIRFATPVYHQGKWQGVAVLSLDHRHLMTFTQHISPIDDQDTVFPSYESGNYAFMFDDEGWMITHPKFWNIRGFDADGELVPAYTVDTPQEVVDAGRIPFNLLTAGFVHPNYPQVANLVRRGVSGALSTVNVGGSNKIMAYAPIPYHKGIYQQSGVFGGVTIGAEIDLFHLPATSTALLIQNEINNYLMQSWLVISITVLLVAFVAYLLSNSIVRPIHMLTEGTRKMTSGHQLRVKVDVTSNDEVGVLAGAFNQMVEELTRRRERLLRTMLALRQSRKEIISERNFKNTLFENIETGLITFDSQGRVTSANGPACRILQMSRPTDNPAWQQLLNDWPELKITLDNWFNTSNCERKNSHPVYVPIERKGRKLTYRTALFPLSFRQQDGWLLTIEDLTERVNMRQQMARMDRLASLGRMSAGIAHEVRNPLTGVSLLLDELHDRLLGQQTDQLLIRRALEEIERLETLVTQMLRFSAAKAPRLNDGRIGEVLSDSIFLLRNQCQRQQVRLIEQIASDLPVLLLDADRIKQVVLNLLNNALDAMPKGGDLTIRAEQVDNNILITIADTGEGINPDQLPLVFEPFFTTKGQGTGLGLSICHNIITDHGGDIQIDSTLQQGTRVQIILPLTVDQPVSVNESF